MAAVNNGAAVYATNLERSHPGSGARSVPETSSLIQAITPAAPQSAVVVVDKPDVRLFLAALSALGGRGQSWPSCSATVRKPTWPARSVSAPS